MTGSLQHATAQGMFTQNRRGFTLVEVIVVLGVVALLVAILIPALGAVKASGVRASCMANLRGLGHAIALYRGARNSLFPDVPSMPDLPAGREGLIGAIGDYCDAPVPIVGPDGDVTANAPWRCRADPTVAARFGMSYEYEIATLVIVYEADGYPEPIARVSLFADDNPGTVILSDAPPFVRGQTADSAPWHDGPGAADQNALRADGSVDWLR